LIREPRPKKACLFISSPKAPGLIRAFSADTVGIRWPAGTWQRMGIYADVFTALSQMDMRKRFPEFGVDLDVDPPWGSETYKK